MFLDCGTHGTKKNLLTIMQAQTNPINQPRKWAKLVVIPSDDNTGDIWLGDGSLNVNDESSALIVLQAGTNNYTFGPIQTNLIFANSVWIYVPVMDNAGINIQGDVT